MRKTSAQIADEVVATPTKEMLDHFNNRTNRHIELVRKYCTKLEERVPGLEGLHQRGLDHDQSKYESKEKIPYVWLTWRYKCEDDKKPCVLPTGMKRMIDEATEHHILTNAHHPEFHQGKTSNLINKEDRDKPPKEMIDATKMSKLDLAEMVADWCAMSEERGNTPHEWAKKNVNVRWKYTPEQVKHINQFMDAAWSMKKTASEIGDEVLKTAIDLATLRRVSSGIMKRHGVRGGMSLDPQAQVLAILRRPAKGGRIAFGPALTPELRQSGRKIELQQLQGTENPKDIGYSRGPIFSGGRRGSFVDIAGSPLGQQMGLSAPASSLGKEVTNRVGLLHEGLERRALKPGTTIASRSKNWGGAEVPTIEEMGMVGGGHMSPGVILRESNIVGTLPKGVPQESVRRALKPLREAEGTWPTIQQAVGRDLPYGEQRFSRHAIRRIEDLIRR